MRCLKIVTVAGSLLLALQLGACSQLQIRWVPADPKPSNKTPAATSPTVTHSSPFSLLSMSAITIPDKPLASAPKKNTRPSEQASSTSSAAQPDVSNTLTVDGNSTVATSIALALDAPLQSISVLEATPPDSPDTQPSTSTDKDATAVRTLASTDTALPLDSSSNQQVDESAKTEAVATSTIVPDASAPDTTNNSDKKIEIDAANPSSSAQTTPSPEPEPSQPPSVNIGSSPVNDTQSSDASQLRTDAISLDHSMEEIAAIDIVNEFCPDMIDPKALPRFRTGMQRVLRDLLPPGKDPFMLLSALRQDPDYIAALNQAREDSSKFTIEQNKDLCLDVILLATKPTP